jgi:N-methylhydantoinase B
VRRGSGGDGEHRGGDGVVRAYRVLAPCAVTLITERRRHPPQGLAGGLPGAVGRNLLNGQLIAAKCRVELSAGDVLTIETPGGGGWGRSRPA